MRIESLDDLQGIVVSFASIHVNTADIQGSKASKRQAIALIPMEPQRANKIKQVRSHSLLYFVGCLFYKNPFLMSRYSEAV